MSSAFSEKFPIDMQIEQLQESTGISEFPDIPIEKAQ
jgi:hypothetical protein